jgi:hypothetical protein
MQCFKSLGLGPLPLPCFVALAFKDTENLGECFLGKQNNFLQQQIKFFPLVDVGFGEP